MLSIHHPPPGFTEHDAELIAFDIYGMLGEARALPGEHDRNFVFEADDGQPFCLRCARASSTTTPTITMSWSITPAPTIRP
jgi:Ser/Thr protein kinase RdoA (MazF antagonist)